MNKIRSDSNGVLDPGERSPVTSTDLFYTPDVDEAGSYRFEKLTKGTYSVRQIVPDVLSATPAAQHTRTVTVGPADDRNDIDCGDQYRPSEIHGFEFEDSNGNHVRDAGDAGWEVLVDGTTDGFDNQMLLAVGQSESSHMG